MNKYNNLEPDVVAPIVWVIEKLCIKFPRFEKWLNKICTPKPGTGTNSRGPK